MKIDIRLATPDDASEILEIIKLRYVDSSKSSKETKTGLIDYKIPDLDKLKLKISKGIFYVATEEEKVVGFIDAYLSKNLKDIFSKDVVANRLLEIEAEPFIYLNTLAIKKEFESKGISTSLFEKIPSNRIIWACIVHKPIRNVISESIFTKRFGFKFVEELETDFGITFGLYKKYLK